MKVELLAPGGSFDSVIAAYNAGADAVYTGGMLFGARAGADNLTTEQLIEALEYAHIHGRKLYLTVNTLLKDNEIEKELFDFIAPLYENGLDAVIVQDMGVLSYIKEHFKGLHIHASTQMTIFGKETVKELEKLGVTRIVTPRELSFEEIKDIRQNSNIEIESFVHGALCYCYSGQCFLSSYIGGRSGNRGRCAQPCRMEYDVIYNGDILNKGNNKYILSPKDICTLKILPQIIESGVNSLKIEGRMKKKEYITGVVSIYRKYLDLYLNSPDKYYVDNNDIEKLADLFQRNGFNESYYKQHNGRDMISLKKPAFRKENKELVEYLKNTYTGKKLKRNIDVQIKCLKDTPFEISAIIDNETVIVRGDIPQKALNKPIDQTTVEKQIRKTGNTDFNVYDCNIELDEDLFIQMGAINELRREFFEQVKNVIIKKFKRKQEYTIKSQISEINCRKEDNKTESLIINADVWNTMQLKEVLESKFIKIVYLESSGFSKKQMKDAIDAVKNAQKTPYIALPYVFRKEDKNYFDKNMIDFVKYTEGVLIRSVEEYYHLKNMGVEKKIIFDYNVYTENKLSKEYYQHKNVKTTAPLELNFNELKSRGCMGDEFIVYGYMPAMISAGCALKTGNKCLSNNSVYKIKDRKNNYFYTRCVCEHCYNIMYNCKPLSLFKFTKEIKALNADSIRLSFTTEDAGETEKILKKAEKAFIEGEAVYEDDTSTRGHFKRGVL